MKYTKLYCQLIFSLCFLLFAARLLMAAGTPNLSGSYHMKIGVSCPLSGDLAEYGAAVRGGIELARAEDPESFSRISFFYEDNQYDSAMAVTALNKLRNVNGVDLIYNWGEPTLHAIAPIVERMKLPVVAMSLDPEPALNRRHIIRSINHSDQYAKTLLQYLRERGLKKIGIVKTEDPFLNSMIAGLKKHLRDGESVEVAYSFLPGETDFKTAISGIRVRGYDVLGVYLFSGQVSSFFRQAGALGLALPTFGTDFFESRTEIRDAGGHMHGAVYPNIQVPESFARSYRARYGNDIQIAYAYNAYVFATRASRLFGPLEVRPSSEEILERLAHVDESEGRFTFKSTPRGGRFYEFPLVVKQIWEGEIRVAS